MISDPQDLFDPKIYIWEQKHPGDKNFCCEFCGIYTAAIPRCNKCEEFKNDNLSGKDNNGKGPEKS